MGTNETDNEVISVCVISCFNFVECFAFRAYEGNPPGPILKGEKKKVVTL